MKEDQNEKLQLPFLDKLGKRDVTHQVLNGKDTSEYNQVYLLRSFQCKSCETLFVIPPNAILWKWAIEDIKMLGKELHKSTTAKAGVICVNPKLIIIWDNAFVLAELLK